MKIKIESDAFDIVTRIKEIDDGYYIVYDTKRNCYELHNSNQINSYCLSIPFDEIDARIIDLIYYTNVLNIDNIMQDIDKDNNEIDRNNNNEILNQTKYMSEEIFKFCNNSSKKYDVSKAFESVWS